LPPGIPILHASGQFVGALGSINEYKYNESETVITEQYKSNAMA